MKKVYKVSIVGAYNGLVLSLYSNTIANSRDEAVIIANNIDGDQIDIWSKNVKLSILDTIKYYVLKLLGLKSVKVYNDNTHYGIDLETGDLD